MLLDRIRARNNAPAGLTSPPVQRCFWHDTKAGASVGTRGLSGIEADHAQEETAHQSSTHLSRNEIVPTL